ncbi:MAG: hypothetical protein ABIZ80_13555, partial [Bryobacteraceae bacterium]
ADGTARTISMLLVIGPGGASATAAREATSGCIPTTLLPLSTSLPPGFAVPSSWPAPIETRVVDDCGNPQSTGSVVVTFSNGDPGVTLTSLKDGRWTGTWRARGSAGPQVTVNMAAADPSRSLRGAAQVAGTVRPGTNTLLFDRVVSAASQAPNVPLAPGSLVSIMGTGLSDSEIQATETPLPTSLGGAKVLVAGVPLPLVSVSPGLVNAVMPYDLAVNTRYQVVVQNGARFASSEPVAVAAAQPAIFSQDRSGSGQGLVYVVDAAGAQTLADSSSPAAAGNQIVIQCTGLGAVDPPVPAGEVVPQEPVSRTVNPVSLTIGGQQAEVSSATLLAGATGIYVIQATVPTGVAAGVTVPVVISVAGQLSPAVNIAVN